MTEPLLFRSPRRTEASGIRTRYSQERERFARMPERALFLPDRRGPYENGESHPTGGKYDKELPATVPIPMFLRSSGLSSCPTTDGTECTAPPRAGTTRTRNPCSETIACRNDGRPSQTPDSRCPSVPPFSAFGSSRTSGLSFRRAWTDRLLQRIEPLDFSLRNVRRRRCSSSLFSGKRGDGFFPNPSLIAR